MSLIEIKKLTKKYDDITPLKNVDLSVESGEIVSIIGPSGTGKSTLLRCINRLETPTSGSIIVDGVDVCEPTADLSSVRKKMGMVFQSFNLFAHKNAAENIMMPQMDLLGKTEAEAYKEALLQLDRVGLVGARNKFPDELSGGQKQRVAIARALAMHPKILLFDEPTSALDPTMVSEVLSVINELSGTGLTMLIVTHEMRLARDISTRVLFMNEGGIFEQGTPEKIFEHPDREETKSFIFRIKSFVYDILSEHPDVPEILANIESFCKRQFLTKKSTLSCMLTVEEIVVNFLIPCIKQFRCTKIPVRLDSDEGGEQVFLEVDFREIPYGRNPFREGADDISMSIIKNNVSSFDYTEPNVIRFQIKT